MWSFMPLFFHWASCLPGSSLLSRVSVLHSFVRWLAFHYIHTPHFVCLFMCWWTKGCVHLLAVVNNALWTFVFKFLCGRMFSFVLGAYLGAELLGQTVTLCWTFEELPDGCPKLRHHLRAHQPCLSLHLSTLSPILVTWLCDCRHSRGREVVSQGAIDLHFPTD